ncbi:hypothetical protein [Hyphomicrobium zavarzinii]|uniref:hypothetical protein n=1 Tax=Hyphomicrobium zavarzinii TaxID=48292 RepID=UPI000366B669|nr:hypothetical protein [Hyphomicrobium zavarzinii]
MKLRISMEGVRVRLTAQEFAELRAGFVRFQAWGFAFSVVRGRGSASSLVGWPASGEVRLSERDWRDFEAEPENGIVIQVEPPVVLEAERHGIRKE